MAFNGLLLENTQRKPSSTEQPFWEPDEFEYEDYTGYCKGGYCPIKLYDKLKDSRYCVEYKLGHGRFATVWLARDDGSPDKCLVALKVLTAHRSVTSSETALLRMVADFDTGHGPNHVIHVLDEFDIASANGTHRVQVMPVTRSVKSLSTLNMPFQPVVKAFVQGLNRIHSAGIVHGGKKTNYRMTSLIET